MHGWIYMYIYYPENYCEIGLEYYGVYMYVWMIVVSGNEGGWRNIRIYVYLLEGVVLYSRIRRREKKGMYKRLLHPCTRAQSAHGPGHFRIYHIWGVGALNNNVETLLRFIIMNFFLLFCFFFTFFWFLCFLFYLLGKAKKNEYCSLFVFDHDYI